MKLQKFILMSTINYEQITNRTLNVSDMNGANPIRTSQNRSINNAETIDRIARIIVPQITNNPLENDFFNGANFHENGSFGSLILSADWSSFP
jgi:hypothetical protein